MENTMCWNALLAKQGRAHANSLDSDSSHHRAAVLAGNRPTDGLKLSGRPNHAQSRTDLKRYRTR